VRSVEGNKSTHQSFFQGFRVLIILSETPNLVRNLCRRAAYRDGCNARATTTRRGATTNTIQSAFDRTAVLDATADSGTAVSGDAGQRQQDHSDWMPSGGARRPDRNSGRRAEQ
jgi:hypothetical protein